MSTLDQAAQAITPLDLAWEEINALGGRPSTWYEDGYCDAVGEVLAIIEKLGGRDPVALRHSLRQDNRSEADFDGDLAVIRQCIERVK